MSPRLPPLPSDPSPSGSGSSATPPPKGGPAAPKGEPKAPQAAAGAREAAGDAKKIASAASRADTAGVIRSALDSRASSLGRAQRVVGKAAQAKYDADGVQTNRVSQKAAQAAQVGMDTAKDVTTVAATAAAGDVKGAVKAAVTAKTTRRGAKMAGIIALGLIMVLMLGVALMGGQSSVSSSTSHTSNQASAHKVSTAQLDQGQRTSGYTWEQISTAAELAGADPWVVAAAIMDADQNGLSWDGKAGPIVRGTPEGVTADGGRDGGTPPVSPVCAPTPTPTTSASGSSSATPTPTPTPTTSASGSAAASSASPSCDPSASASPSTSTGGASASAAAPDVVASSSPAPSASSGASASPSASSASSAPAAPEVPAPSKEQLTASMPASTAGGDTQVIGDSIAVGATDSMNAQLPGINVDAKAGRTYQQGLDILTAQDPAQRRPITVMALGINSAAGPTELNAALKAVGDTGKLVLVTPAGPRPWVEELTKQMKALAASNLSRVVVADWNATSANVTDFSGDKIHVGSQGSEVYARTIRLAVDAIAGLPTPSGPVSELPSSPSMGSPQLPTIARPTEVNFVGLDPEVDPVKPEDLTDSERALKMLAQQVAEKRHRHFPEGDARSDLGTGYRQTQDFDGRQPDPDEAAQEEREKTLAGWTEVIKNLPILKAEERAARIAQTAVDLHVGKRDLYPPLVTSGAIGTGLVCTAADGSGTGIAIPEQYRAALEDASKTSGIPVEILAGQIQAESEWNPNALNPKSGAAGIAQFVPSTWASVAPGENVYDPQASIRAQGRLMRDMMNHPNVLAFAGDNPDLRIRWALTAYNSGPGRLPETGGDFSRMYRNESRVYAAKILALAGGIVLKCSEVPGAGAGGEYTGELGTGTWFNPLPGSKISSPWGPRPCPLSISRRGQCSDSVINHDGMDLSTGGGAQVIAPTDMTIAVMQRSDQWGWNIRARQIGAPGFDFLFVHCAAGSFSVSEGQQVAAGQPLCIEGDSGLAKGHPHLHFTIIKPGTSLAADTTLENTYNPYPILHEKGLM